jgi:hypothetical protein
MKPIETVKNTLEELGFDCTDGRNHIFFTRGKEMVFVAKPTIDIIYNYTSATHSFLRKKQFRFSQINNSVSQLKNIIGY